MNTIEVVGVVGAGTMGNGIAHVFARSGFQVLLCEVEQRFLDRGLASIRKNLEREVAKGKLTAGRQRLRWVRFEAPCRAATWGYATSSSRQRPNVLP